MSGGGTWTSYTLDAKTGRLYVPGGNPAPDFAIAAREGENLYTASVVVLDAKTGDYKHHFKLVPKDWHDWDVSSPPVLIQTMGGKQIMVAAPKDGYLYGFDLADNSLLYRVPVTQVEMSPKLSRPVRPCISVQALWEAMNGTARRSGSWTSAATSRRRCRRRWHCGRCRSGSHGPGWRPGTRSRCSADLAVRTGTGPDGASTTQ